MTSTGTRRKCSATRADGRPCLAWAVSDSALCMAHDPARAAQMAAARRKGAAARHGRRIGTTGAAKPVTLAGPGDVLRVLESEVNCLLGMEVSISRARAVGALLGVFVSTWESSEVERRLRALEERFEHER